MGGGGRGPSRSRTGFEGDREDQKPYGLLSGSPSFGDESEGTSPPGGTLESDRSDVRKRCPGKELLVEIIRHRRGKQNPPFSEVHQRERGPGRFREIPEEGRDGAPPRDLGELFQKLKK